MNLLAPFGFFGAGNIGDEATLQGFARLIAGNGNGFRVWVASRNPKHTARVEPSFSYFAARDRDWRRRWARFRSSAAIVVGGTPIMDGLGKWPLSELTPLVQVAHHDQKPVVFVGSGVEELKRDDSRRIVAELIAPLVRHWTVRSDRDRQRLIRYGVAPERVTVAADLAWALESVSDRFGKELLEQLGVNTNDYLVGVNLNCESFVIEQEPRLFQKVAEFLDALVDQQGARVLFFANEVREGDTYDTAAARRVIGAMNHQKNTLLIPNDYRTPQQMLSLIDCCDVTVSMRYHFCLFSALQGVPFIGILRSDKVADLCWDMNWPYGVSLSELDPALMLEMCGNIFANRVAATEKLQRQVELMRSRALSNCVALESLASYQTNALGVATVGTANLPAGAAGTKMA